MLLNPNHLTRKYPDRRSGEIMAATVDFFESRGKARLKHDDHERIWYSDFLDFVGRERIFASLLTPASYGADDCRWDTYRISEFAEIMGFYGLSYWYPFQVTALGLGPIWMSANEDAKRKAAAGLEAGEVFAFGLSEQTHGADVYQTDMILTPSDGGWTANGEKYYIGNANVARMVSTFGKIAGTPESQEYVFFVADSQHERYDLIKNVVNSQNYVANYALRDYPVTEADILHRGAEAFHAALNTVNVCKYNLGWGAIGMCTHALYESVTHAANRHLYGTVVTDFSHVRRLLTDAYVRLIAMKLVASRASDYMRSASAADRRYLLYSPLTRRRSPAKASGSSPPCGTSLRPKGWKRTRFSRPWLARLACCPGWKAPCTSTSGYSANSCPTTCSLPTPRCRSSRVATTPPMTRSCLPRDPPGAWVRCVSTTGARHLTPARICLMSHCCASKSTCSPSCWPAPPRTRHSRRISTLPSAWDNSSRTCPMPSSFWRRPGYLVSTRP